MSNKIKVSFIIIVILLIVILTGAFLKKAPVSSISETRILMDTEFTITLYGNNLEAAKEDALKNAGVIVDDGQKYIKRLVPELYITKDKSYRVEVLIKEGINK